MAERSRERVEAEVPDDLGILAKQRDWPEGLLERLLEAGISPHSIRGWVNWRSGTATDMERQLEWHKRLTVGDLQIREACMSDNEAFCDLWANSPEEIGDFEVTTLRGPNGFAQFHLQENVSLHVIADGNVLVASCGWARHNVMIAGQRVSLRYGQALRVHKGYRRQGFGDAVRSFGGGVNTAGPSLAQYDYMRAGNFAVVGWWKKYMPDFFDDVPQQEDEVPGIPVEVQQLPARPRAGSGRTIRGGRREDISRCVELVNRTHEGQDLYRPYSAEFFEDRLDEGYWGERAPWFPPVYSWDDFFVLESSGRVVACGGLWDRGADQRDRFRHRETGEERLISDAALLDWGFEQAAEGAMAELLDHLSGRAHSLGRDFVLAPLEQSPSLLKHLELEELSSEKRFLRWDVKDLPIARAYTDLVYW
jgi:hypothetical protein